VLSWSEAPRHPHNRARSAYISVKRVEQPAPAPRFSRTPGGVQRPPPERGEGGAQALADWGFNAEQAKRLTSLGLGLGEKK
jgi:alpha-methylacyl-CoA racemase